MAKTFNGTEGDTIPHLWFTYYPEDGNPSGRILKEYNIPASEKARELFYEATNELIEIYTSESHVNQLFPIVCMDALERVDITNWDPASESGFDSNAADSYETIIVDSLDDPQAFRDGLQKALIADFTKYDLVPSITNKVAETDSFNQISLTFSSNRPVTITAPVLTADSVSFQGKTVSFALEYNTTFYIDQYSAIKFPSSTDFLEKASIGSGKATG